MPENRNAESVGEWVRSLLRELFQSSLVLWVGIEIPGLLQPWAGISQRFQRTGYLGHGEYHKALALLPTQVKGAVFPGWFDSDILERNRAGVIHHFRRFNSAESAVTEAHVLNPHAGKTYDPHDPRA